MNLCYWGNKLIKLLNLPNSLYNFNNNGNKTEQAESELLIKQARHGTRWSRSHTSHVREGTKGMLARKRVSSQDMLTR